MLACCDIKTHDDLDKCVVEDDDEGQDETTDMKVWCQIPAGCCLVPPPALAGGSFSPQKTQTPDQSKSILSAPTTNVTVYTIYHDIPCLLIENSIYLIIFSPAREPRLAIFAGWRQRS